LLTHCLVPVSHRWHAGPTEHDAPVPAGSRWEGWDGRDGQHVCQHGTEITQAAIVVGVERPLLGWSGRCWLGWGGVCWASSPLKYRELGRWINSKEGMLIAGLLTRMCSPEIWLAIGRCVRYFLKNVGRFLCKIPVER